MKHAKDLLCPVGLECSLEAQEEADRAATGQLMWLFGHSAVRPQSVSRYPKAQADTQQLRDLEAAE